MSFSSQAKEELIHVKASHKGCMLAELCAIAQASGSLVLSSAGVGLEIPVENAGIARRVFSNIKELTGVAPVIHAKKNLRLKKGNTYIVTLTGRDAVQGLLQQAGLVEGEGFSIQHGIPAWIHSTCCKRAYLRGAFLSCGSVSNPEKEYHLELVTKDEAYAAGIQRTLKMFDISAKVLVRKKMQVVYVKESAAISDFLTLVGAHNAILVQENAKIIKQMRNNVNRAVNCETANLNKTVNAAFRQVQCIRFLEKRNLLSALPPALLDAAQARLENPEASIQELGAQMNPPVGKSGMNHRLRRICEVAYDNGYFE